MVHQMPKHSSDEESITQDLAIMNQEMFWEIHQNISLLIIRMIVDKNKINVSTLTRIIEIFHQEAF